MTIDKMSDVETKNEEKKIDATKRSEKGEVTQDLSFEDLRMVTGGSESSTSGSSYA